MLNLGFKEGVTYVKMKKPTKKKSLVFNQERPLLFLNYLDGEGSWNKMNEEECVVKGKEEQLWDKPC